MHKCHFENMCQILDNAGRPDLLHELKSASGMEGSDGVLQPFSSERGDPKRAVQLVKKAKNRIRVGVTTRRWRTKHTSMVLDDATIDMLHDSLADYRRDRDAEKDATERAHRIAIKPTRQTTEKKRTMNMTPNHLEVLLHYYVFGTQHPRMHALAIQQAIRDLIHGGLVELDFAKDTYQTTERGAAHIKQIRKLALPTKKDVWVDEKGEAI